MSEPTDEEFRQRTREVGIDRAVWEEHDRQEAERDARLDALLSRDAGDR